MHLDISLGSWSERNPTYREFRNLNSQGIVIIVKEWDKCISSLDCPLFGESICVSRVSQTVTEGTNLYLRVGS